MELSDVEKLILSMLCEVHAHLNIAGGLDPKFVQSALHSGNTWGLRWKYGALYDGSARSDPPIVKEVVAILDMWSAIEDGYGALAAPDKDRVAASISPQQSEVQFMGFDSDTEFEHANVASFLIKDMQRFPKFAERDIHSHQPSISIYRRMVRAFAALQKLAGKSRLDADQLIALFNQSAGRGVAA
ncbi:MAG: YfbU family protein [Collimonas sp.]|uniref:YfbU family protein n=1 Tax=Collimonas sp. TaxID=1963772 RepID=UPI00326766E7